MRLGKALAAVAFLCFCLTACTDRVITFVHVNDLHGKYTPMPALSDYLPPQPPFGHENPFALIRGYYERIRKQNPCTLLTGGGDDFEKGSVAEPLSQGRATLEAVFALGFDVRVLGNHDFAWGEERVLEFSRDPRVVVLSSNTRYTGADPQGFGALAYSEREFGGVRIGFFGMCPRPYDETNESYTGPYPPNFETRFDYVERAAEIVAAHREEVELLVMVSHLGLDDDRLVASQLDGIDAILGGHSHTDMWTPEIVNGTIIVQSGSSATYVGRLDLVFDPAAGTLESHHYVLCLALPGFLPLQPETQSAIQGIMDTYAPEALESIATVKNPQWAAGIAQVACRAAIQVHGADAALVDQGTLWDLDSWPIWLPGGLSQQKLLDTVKMEKQPAGTPSWNAFYSVEVSGADLERIVSGVTGAWTFAGPEAVDPSAPYQLVLNKRTVFHPGDYLPAGVTIGPPVFAGEVWTTLESYGRARTAACRHIDLDEALPQCL